MGVPLVLGVFLGSLGALRRSGGVVQGVRRASPGSRYCLELPYSCWTWVRRRKIKILLVVTKKIQINMKTILMVTKRIMMMMMMKPMMMKMILTMNRKIILMMMRLCQGPLG